MLFDSRPGEPYEYGAILMLPSTNQEIMGQMIYSPEALPTKLDGHSAYRAVFCGLFWLFIASSHSWALRHEDIFLSVDGQLPVFKVGAPAASFIKRLASEFVAAGMLNDAGQRE